MTLVLTLGRLAAALGLGSGLLALAPPLKAASEAHYTGTAYRLGTDELRYREEHWVFDEAGVRNRLVLYRCPGGAPFARKLLTYRGNPWAPDIDFEDQRTGYRESVHAQDTRLKIVVQRNPGKRPESAELPLRSDTVVDAGFDDFVREHWTAIDRDAGTTARFVVPSRLDALRIKLGPDDDAPASLQYRHFRMALGGLLGVIAPSVVMTYTVAGHRLVQFEGTGNIRDDSGQSQRVRIVFAAADDLPPASAQDIAAARGMPLVSRCTQ